MQKFFTPRIGESGASRHRNARPAVYLTGVTGVLCFLLASAAFAQSYPYGPSTKPRTNNRPRANGQNSTGAVRGTNKADVQLQSEVQALRDRHEALLAKLPFSMRNLDKQALPTVERLPLIAQYGYLTTIEDYPSLASPEQRKLHDTMQSLSGMREPERSNYVTSATKTFGSLQNSPSQMKSARSRPHDTCFQIQDTVAQFRAAPKAPATAAPSKASAAPLAR